MTDHKHSQPIERLCDVAVIGGSAAGLAAALQLVRQRRSVIVVDNGSPRNQVADHMHSYLGYEGASPAELTVKGREEVRSYGGELLNGTAQRIQTIDGRFRVQLSGGHALLARRVLIATGLVDELPSIDGLAEHWGGAVINCPFCHGYEVREQRVVHIVTSPTALHVAPIFRALSDRYSIVLHDVSIQKSEEDRLRDAGIEVTAAHVARVVNDDDHRLRGLMLDDGKVIDADAVVVSPRFHVRDDAFEGLGLKMLEHPSGLGSVVETDFLGKTSLPGLYAAGNVADPTLQVLPAAAHGSRVGAAVSLDLATEDSSRRAGPNDWDHRYSGDPIWSGNPNGTLVREVKALPPGRVLDVGAGEGGDAIWLAEQGWQVTANDVSSRALDHVARVGKERGMRVQCLHRDASTLNALPTSAFDLVSLQYGAIPRSPDQRGLRNVVDAVAPGGTLLVVAHDLEPMRVPIDPHEQTNMWDVDAYFGVDEFLAAIEGLPGWEIECHEKRPRPHGAATSHHVDDVVLRARRL